MKKGLKRISALALTAVMSLQCLGAGFTAMAANPDASVPDAGFIKDSLDGFQGTVMERRVIDAEKKIFEINLYAYDQESNGGQFMLSYDTDIVAPYTTGAVAMGESGEFALVPGTDTEIAKMFSAELKTAYGYMHYRNGTMSSQKKVVSLTDGTHGFLTYPASAIDVNAGTISVDFGRNVAFGPLTQFEHIDSDGFWAAVNNTAIPGEIYKDYEDYSLGYGLITFVFQVQGDYKLADVTTDVIHPNATGDNWNDSGMKLCLRNGASNYNIYYTGFPVPAKAPTDVTITATPTAAIAGEDVTLTVSGASLDGGTLTYAYTTGETAPTAEEMAALTFQSAATFTVTAADSATKYWGVVKNTKTEDGEDTYAYAASAASASVTVQQAVSAVTVNMTAPVTGNTAADTTATVAEGADYTVKTVTWTPADETFAANTAYSAKVTLSVNSDALFVEAAKTAITLNGAGESTAENAALNTERTELSFDVTFALTGKSAQELVTESKTAIEGATFSMGEIVTGAGTADVADNTTAADVKKAVEETLKGLVSDGVVATLADPTITAAVPGKPDGDPIGTDGSFTVAVTLTSGRVTDTVSVAGTIVALPASKHAQNQQAVQKAVTALSGEGQSLAQVDATSESMALNAVRELAANLTNDKALTLEFTSVTYTGAKVGTFADRKGVDGSVTFTVKVSKGTIALPEGTSPDAETDYIATATSAPITMAIKATAFAGKLLAPGMLTVSDVDDGTVDVMWSAPKTNGVPITGYTVSLEKVTAPAPATNPAPVTVGANVTAYHFEGLENDQTYKITVTASFTEKLIEDNAFSVNAIPTLGAKVTVTLKDATVTGDSGDVTDANACEVVITRTKFDQEIGAGDVHAGKVVELYAKPADGYQFVRWELTLKDAVTTFARDGAARADTTKTLTANPITLTPEEIYAYDVQPVVAEVETVATGAPMLRNLLLSMPEGRALYAENGGTQTTAFIGTQTEYSVYLLNQESKLTLQPYVNGGDGDVNAGIAAGKYDVEYSYTELTGVDNTPTTNTVTYTVDQLVDVMDKTYGTGAPIELTIPAGASSDVTFTVTEKAGTGTGTGGALLSTTYTIHVKRVAEHQNPQIRLELDSNTGTRIASMNVRVTDAVLTAGEFSINLSENTTDPTIKFNSFVTKDGVALADGQQKSQTGAYTMLGEYDDLFKIEDMTVSNSGKTITVTFASRTGKPVEVTNGQLFTFYLVKNEACVPTATDEQLLKSLELNNAAPLRNTMDEKTFGSLRYVDKVDGTAAVELPEAERLVYLKLAAKYVVVGYVNGRNGLNSTERLEFNVYDIKVDATGTQTVNDLPVKVGENGLVFYRTSESTYNITITSPGFKPYTFENVKVDGDTDLTAIVLVAGDVNNDGVINADDRALLVEALGGEVQDNIAADPDNGIAATIGGFVENSRGDKVYADLNDDGVVNALDLGITLRNITKEVAGN